jgi:ABC-type transport system involved in cytochrome bd biosynthesis fused ATPase/permease subunit
MFTFIYLHPSIPVFVAIAIAFGVIVFHGLSKKNKQLAVIASIFASGLVPLVAMLVVIIGSSCNTKVAHAFNIFNPHLLELCYGQAQGTCPRTEDELRAFNPEMFKEITRCTETQFFFDQATEQSIWSVRLAKDKTILVSGATDFGVSSFSLEEAQARGYWK